MLVSVKSDHNQVEAGSAGRLSDKGRRPVPESLDARVLRDAVRFLDRGQTLELSYVLNNTQRTVGAAVSSAIVRRFGAQGPAGRLRLQLEGVSGQSSAASRPSRAARRKLCWA